MKDTVLFLDDDSSILRSIQRMFRDSGIRIITMDNPVEALKMIQNGEVAVVVSDNRMPVMQGTEFLSRARNMQPDTVRIMMTGYVDFSSAMRAINQCEVYKFITKPWNNEELVSIIRESLDRHRMIQVMRNSEESTLLSLARTVELKDPYTRGHCDSVARYALAIADALELSDDIRTQIRNGSWLHDCGKIGVPESVLKKTGPLTPDEYAIVKNHPVWGADVARQARLSQVVIDIIQSHHERWDGKGYPFGIKGNAIPLEARIVSIADVFDALTSDRSYRRRHSNVDASGIIYSMKGTFFDPYLSEVFLKLIAQEVVAEKDRLEVI